MSIKPKITFSKIFKMIFAETYWSVTTHLDHWWENPENTLRKIPYFTKFPGMETSWKGTVSETMRKLSHSKRFPYQKIRWNYGISSSDIHNILQLKIKIFTAKYLKLILCFDFLF